jgi:hypothetical protein
MNPLALSRRRLRGLLTGLFGWLWPRKGRPSTAARAAPRQPPAVIAFGGDPLDTTTTTTLVYDSAGNCCGGIDPAG